MKKTCLLLKTKDGRRFLTHEKNLPSLIEFTKTFSAEIYKVEVEGEKIMELKALANAICSQDYSEKPKCAILEKVYPIAKKSRDKILKDAAKIKKYIRKRLLDGKAVSLKELKTKYKSCNVTDACLCTHLSAARKALTQEGHRIRKLGAGKYQVVTTPTE
jgi:hypothetical protein